jgi:hypothetical protein
MQFSRAAGLAFVLSVLVAGSANAGSVFLETFDSGSANFATGDDSYWLNYASMFDGGESNGAIITDTNHFTNWPSWSNAPWTASIPNDVSGSGYFLMEGTQNYNWNENTEFYIGPSFSVTPSTMYTVSFYATSADTVYLADLQPEIDSNLLGSPVSPGLFYYDGWQQFSFSWNSGSNTSASVVLNDFNLNGSGNDFAVDDISVTSAGAATPEPGTLALAGLGFAAALLLRKRVF